MSARGFFDPKRAKAVAAGASGIPGRVRQARVSVADRPADGGFASLRGAKVVIRRLKLRAALNDAQASIAALLELLDEQLDADRDARPAPIESGVGLAQGNLEGCVGRLSIDGVEGKDVREKELLQGVNLILQLLDTISVGLRHGLFSVERSPAFASTGDDGHSLCDAPKYGGAA